MTYEIKCYKIWWKDNPDKYVGSTKQRLSMRMTGHRRIAKEGNVRKIYEAIRKYGYDFNYVMLESCMVNSTDEQRMMEQEWIDELKPSLNTNMAYRSKDLTYAERGYNKKFYHAHKKEQNKRSKDYHKANNDKIRKRKRELYHAKKLDPLFREKYNKKCKDYRKANNDKIRKRERERYHAKKLQQLNQEPKKEVAVAEQQIQKPVNPCGSPQEI